MGTLCNLKHIIENLWRSLSSLLNFIVVVFNEFFRELVIRHFQRGCNPEHGMDLIINFIHDGLRQHVWFDLVNRFVLIFLLLNLLKALLRLDLLLKFIFQLSNDVFEDFSLNRLRQDLVHAAVDSSLDVVLLSVASYCQDYRLSKVKFLKVCPNFVWRLISIHKWHVTVHHDQVISCLQTLISFDVLLDLLESLEAILSKVTDLVTILEFDAILQNDHGCIDVEALVVNNQNSLAFIAIQSFLVFENLESNWVEFL